MSAIRSFLEKQFGPNFADNNKNTALQRAIADECRNHSDALDQVLKNGKLSIIAIATVQFVQAVLDCTGGDLDICGCIWGPLNVTSLDSLARVLFPRTQVDQILSKQTPDVRAKLTATAVEKLRSAFFDRQPQLVLQVLLQAGKFGITDAQRKTADCIFSQLICGNGDINSVELAQKAAQAAAQQDGGKQPSDKDVAAALDFVKSVILLSRVVEDPDDVPLLQKAGYDSVRQITQRLKGDFQSQMSALGMKAVNALKVHDCAQRLDCWNEQLWLSLMQSHTKDFVPIAVARSGDINAGNSSSRPLNNLTDIFKLEESDCEECCSVTGLSAYLADLLLLLRNTTFKTALTITDDNDDTKTFYNLLDVLFDRRPDLRKLQLSCANSQTFLPYICLVNEVLESYVRSHTVPPIVPSDLEEDSIRAYQTPSGFEEGGDSAASGVQYRPVNTDYEVYRERICGQMYPFTTFPYDLSRDLEASIFATLELDFPRFIQLFQSSEQLLRLIPDSRRSQLDKAQCDALLRGAEETLQRQLAAEELGLLNNEFSAITSETFFPSAFADLVNGLSPALLNIDKTCLFDACTLWGYDDDDQMLDPQAGLSLIKNQFMLRSGLEFQDVLDIVGTRCFGQHLIVTNADGTQEFSTYIESLRLLSNATSPPYMPLTAGLAFQLQAFLRLQAKLKWPTPVLDAALTGFRNLELATLASARRASRTELPEPKNLNTATADPNKPPLFPSATDWEASPAEVVSISPFVIKGIAALKRLSKLTDVDAASLLPLWTPVDTYGPKSLFHREYMTKRLQQIDSIFLLHKDPEHAIGQYLTVDGKQVKVDDHARGLCIALKWPTTYFEQLMSVANCKGKLLDIDSFSALYRHALFCRVLEVPPKLCEAFFKVFSADGGRSMLSSPAATVTAIETWKRLLDSGWEIDVLIDTLRSDQREDEQTADAIQAGLQFALDLATGAKDLAQSVPTTISGATPNAADVVSCASRLFDASTAKAVGEYVEDLKPLPAPSLVKFPLLRQLSSIIESTTQPASSTQPAKSPATSQPVTNGTTAIEKDIDQEAVAAENARLAKEKADLDATIQLRQRRSEFIKLAAPNITDDLLKAFLARSVSELIPETDSALILTLLADLVAVPTLDGKTEQPALAALQELTVLVDDATTADVLDAYFSSPSSDIFTLTFSGDLKEQLPTLSIDNLEVPYDRAAKTFTTFRLNGGKLYHLSANFGAKDVTWSTSKTTATAFTDKTLTAASVARRAASVIGAIKRIAKICQIAGLTAGELQYLVLNKQKKDENLIVNLGNLSLGDLDRLTKYEQLRKRESGGSGSLIGLFGWLSSATASITNSSIATKLADATGWKQTRILDTLNASFEGLSGAKVGETLRDFTSFLKFTDIMIFNEDIENSCAGGDLPSIAALFKLARPRLSLSVSPDDFQQVLDLHNGLAPSQKTNIDIMSTPRRRKALVEFLLQQQSVIDQVRTPDADGLFELLLIDVQMGPQLRTSRTKQAISVVQLFVQRCLLGMEAGIPKNLLARDKWSWMQQYTIWEAHRKMFLYPENWLEPTLRDNKSPLFEQLETVLMQKNLSVTTFLQAVQDYAYNLNGISSLDIVSYLHEPHPGAEDIFHLFGRTRTAPHTFYYRTLTVYHKEDSVFWQPWQKMDVDIPSVESNWDSKRLQDSGAYLMPILQTNRLYIFFPQVTVKTVNVTSDQAGTAAVATGEQPATTWDKMREAPVTSSEPRTSWEITMAWSEFVKETWTPKRVSPGSLIIDPPRPKPKTDQPNVIPPRDRLPSVWEFRLDPLFETERLRIVVSHAPETTLDSKVVGSFDFSRDQIIANQDPGIKLPTSQFAIYFGKVKGANSTLMIPGTDDNKKDPLVWLPDSVKSKESVKWTLSKTPSRLTGLVLNVQQNNGSSTSYFNVPEMELLPTAWTRALLGSRMSLKALDHSFTQDLMQAATNRVDPLQQIYRTMSGVPYQQLADSFGLVGGRTFYHELGSPCALYNWEIGVHSIMLAVDRFFATQQFEEALEVARLLFDPTVDSKVVRKQDSNDVTVDPKAVSKNGEDTVQTTQSCWRFPPFQDISTQIDKHGNSNPDLNNLAAELQLAIKDRRSYGQLVHAAARGRPQAYMKWIILKYAEILLAAGDALFRRGTLEDLPLAIQRYTEAAHVLGPEPVKGLKIGQKKPLCFDDVIRKEVQFNLSLPFSAQLKRNKDQNRGSASAAETDPKKEAVRSFILTSYFCVPLNPKFKNMRSQVHERLYNIRNSLDINGRPVVYALREPPIDPAQLVALGAAGGGMSNDLAMLMSDQNGPLTRYRFETRLGRAFDLCNELRALAERMIAAIEKKESEEFGVLRARNATIIQQIMLSIKETQLLDTQQTLESLKMSRTAQASQMAFFLESIGEARTMVPKETDGWNELQQDIGPITTDDMRMSTYEKAEMDNANTAAVLNTVAAGIDLWAQYWSAMPSISGNVAPLGVGTTVSAGGSNVAAAIQIGSMSVKMAAMIHSEKGNQAGRKGRLAKQLQDRRLQINSKGHEIKATDKQIEIQNIRIKAAEKDVEAQRASMEDSAQAEAYYRTKYTNQQLYAWMEKGLRNLYFQAYALTLMAAQQAEAALSFDQGRKVSVLKPGGYWDASRDGLLAADNLLLDLKRLESLHLEGPKSDYEITKTVSLRQINPLALMKLRATGSAEFSLTELQYDIDFPGHYMRRIRSVGVSILAVISPHSSVNATLTLTKHQYRLNSTAANAKDYLATNSETYGSVGVPISSVAISSGSNDAGVFELNFSGSKYVPFEGAGAISSWRLTLPTEIRKFDYDTISDVMLHVQYTSREGGECLRAAANEAVRITSKTIENEGKSQGFYAMFDLQNDFVNAWHGFSSRLLSSYKASKQASASMDIGNVKDRLPFWSRRQSKLVVKDITLLSKSGKLVRGLSMPAATGEEPTTDVGRVGDGESAFTTKTFSELSTKKWEGWKIDASGAVLGEDEQAVQNVYMFIHYVFA